MDMLERINYSNATSIKKSIYKIAAQLTSEYLLQVNDSYFLLTDIEFYIHTKDATHKDEYTHGHDQQLTHGQLYVHGSGFDITIGNNDEGVYGGVLCRGGVALDKCGNRSKYIDGPILLRTEVFGKLFPLMEANQPNIIRLIPNDILKENNSELITTSRIGLNADAFQNASDFHSQPLRFVRLYPYDPYKFSVKGIEKILTTLVSEEHWNNDKANSFISYKKFK